jgi:ComF family protein
MCGACLHHPPAFTRVVCAVDYGFPWDRLVASFKFHGQPELAAPLAHCIARAVQAQQATPPGLDLPQALLPVPLAAQRLAERGYNQAWELARRLSRNFGIPAWHHVLARPVDTMQQAELGRQQRQANLRSAFMTEPQQRSRLQGLHLALVDDVMTTGATVGEAAAELLRAGARQVDVWVLARTPAGEKA